MLRKAEMVLLGAILLVAGIGVVVRAQTLEVVPVPAEASDPTAVDSLTEDLQKVQSQCAEDGGWFDLAAGVCNEPSE